MLKKNKRKSFTSVYSCERKPENTIQIKLESWIFEELCRGRDRPKTSQITRVKSDEKLDFQEYVAVVRIDLTEGE